jgi:hypothetical protein
VSNPSLTFLRKLALAVAEQDQLNGQLSASELYKIAADNGVDIPGLHEPDEDKGKRVIGSIMARLFKNADTLPVDDFTVSRQEVEMERSNGGGKYPAKTYEFRQVP